MKTNSNIVQTPFAALLGLDWGDRQPAVALLDCPSGITETSPLEHSAEQVHAWLNGLAQRCGAQPVAIALETSKGALIHMFLDVPWLTVFPIHPASSARRRKAFAPSGAKDDVPDAQVLLPLLVHPLPKLRPLLNDDVSTRPWAGLCEMRRQAVDQGTPLSNE